jgi:hypothetical protein
MPEAIADSKLDAGKSYVVFGKANGSVVNLSAIASVSNPLGGFVINGEAASDYSGYSVSSAGDVNGDGLDDLTKPPKGLLTLAMALRLTTLPLALPNTT